MSLLSWNCRGLGGLRTVYELTDVVSKYKPNFVFLCETHCTKNRLEGLKCKLGMCGLFVVESVGRSGGLGLFWDLKSGVTILGYSNRFIDVNVEIAGIGNWRMTCYYGEPDQRKRVQSWDTIKHLSECSSLPWVCCGDFNDLRSRDEKVGGAPYPNWLCNGFNAALEFSGLDDLRVQGNVFTWDRGRGSSNWIRERLDRVVSNVEWVSKFPNYQVHVLPSGSSDHCFILLQLAKPVCPRRRRHFCFENAWLEEEECRVVVENAWNHSNGVDILGKIVYCGAKLGDWGRNKLNGIEKKIAKARRDMEEHSVLIDCNDRYKTATKEYLRLLKQKDDYWRQRAKVNWIREGDQNTKFFHSRATVRQNVNKLEGLRDSNGRWCRRGSGMEELIVGYFEELFTSQGSNEWRVCSMIDPSITRAQNDILLAPFTAEEIRLALNSMHPNKSPGADGMNPAFFQKFWSIVGTDVVDSCLQILDNGELPAELNQTNIVLIPKKDNPQVLADWRPIALCNVLYKIVAKTLANRLKLVLPHVVSESQSAFIPGRLITDTIMVASEILHFLKRKRQGKEGIAALKVDMSKAYDRVEWGYLREVMKAMGFDERWIKLVMMCITSVSYHVVLGNDSLGPIYPGRGLRQGDPLSPYLFILCAQGLSALLQHKEQRGDITGCKLAATCPSITHLFFADDCFLFFKANIAQAAVIKDVLLQYEQVSGQQVNFLKSSFSFSKNTTAGMKADICHFFTIPEANVNELYLGVPMTVGRNKRAIFGYMKNRMEKRIQGWGNRLLSRAGKEVLIKSVAQALPNYLMSVYLLPKDLCEELERMMNSFWWGKGLKKSGIHWKSWGKLCKPKMVGGLGFRRLYDFNLALIAKQGWRMLTNPQSLVARIYKSRYFSDSSFLDASLGGSPSIIWSGIIKVLPMIRKSSIKVIGDGLTTFVFKDPWMVGVEDAFVTTFPSEDNASLRVADLFCLGRKCWDIDKVYLIFPPQEAQQICSIPLSQRISSDFWSWKLEKRGVFSVKSAYRFLSNLLPEEYDQQTRPVWNKIWRADVAPKVKDFSWRLVSNCLPTKYALYCKRVAVTLDCSFCNVSPENIDHIFYFCPFAQEIWRLYGFVFRGASFVEWMEGMLGGYDMNVKDKFLYICWALWKRRNTMCWNSKCMSIKETCFLINSMFLQWKARRGPKDVVQLSPSMPTQCLSTWKRPPHRSLKINCDAALFSTSHCSSCACVLRDHHALFSGARSFKSAVLFDPHVAEALAVKLALSWCAEAKFHNVQIESDAELVVKAILGPYHDCSLFGQIIQDCQFLLSLSSDISIHFVRRSANRVAHSLARASDSMSDFNEWGSIPPSCIVSELLSDNLA